MKLLVVLLRRHVSLWQLVCFALGGLLGAVILLLSLQSFRDVNRAFTTEDAIFSENYVVISKPVSLLTTVQSLIGGKSPSFEEREIQELEALPDVSCVAPFRSAHFTVEAIVRSGKRSLRTEMFLESVPDDFVDLADVNIEWKADLNDRFVPVLVPRNYLDLYNFGYASTRGLPQLSEGAVSQFSFQLFIGGSFYHARIVGFSTRLNTILVPDAFLAEANRIYGNHEKEEPSRLVIRTKGDAAGNALLQHIAHHQYIVADGGDAMVRMQSMVYGVVWAVTAVGLLVTVLAFFLLVVSLLLLVEKNRDIFHNLASLGYTLRQMSAPYRLLVILVDVTVWLLAAIVSVFVYPQVGDLILMAAPSLEPTGAMPLFLIALLCCALFVVIHFFVIWRAIKKVETAAKK